MSNYMEKWAATLVKEQAAKKASAVKTQSAPSKPNLRGRQVRLVRPHSTPCIWFNPFVGKVFTVLGTKVLPRGFGEKYLVDMSEHDPSLYGIGHLPVDMAELL